LYILGFSIPPLAEVAKLIAAASNIGKPLSKEAFPPPPTIAKLPENAQSPFLYTACMEGITGAEAFPS
jgi:hypothetical protein